MVMKISKYDIDLIYRNRIAENYNVNKETVYYIKNKMKFKTYKRTEKYVNFINYFIEFFKELLVEKEIRGIDIIEAFDGKNKSSMACQFVASLYYERSGALHSLLYERCKRVYRLLKSKGMV